MIANELTGVVRPEPKNRRHAGFKKLREQFPVLSREVYGKKLVYLDNAATTQKPLAVIEKVSDYYKTGNANIHRGVHFLSQEATEAYEDARTEAQHFVNAAETKEIIFTRGATEGINLVAQAFGRMAVGRGDEIILSRMEHHSNIVPWQILCEQAGARIRVLPMDDRGELLLEELPKMINSRTRIVSVVHVSNALGTVNNVREIIKTAHLHGVPVLLDAAQSAPHIPIDVQDLDADFLVLSGHKVYAPTGIGILYGKDELLSKMPPYQGGGEMIGSVTFEKTTYNKIPFKYEAGTPNIAGGIGFGAALGFIQDIGLEEINAYEKDLLDYAHQVLLKTPGVRLIGTAKEKAGAISFMLEDFHPHDVGTILDQEGIAVRTGHHCTQPIMDYFGIPATVRASFSFYNTFEEVDALAEGLHVARSVLGLGSRHHRLGRQE
ncbi:MAG: cysteine desulfurase [Acidobacteriota bacterium]